MAEQAVLASIYYSLPNKATVTFATDAALLDKLSTGCRFSVAL